MFGVTAHAGPGGAVRRLVGLAGGASRGADLTAGQVPRQLNALGCERYELGVIAPKGRDDLKAERIRTLTAEQVRNSIGWCRRMNLLGYDIYIRPAVRANGMAEPLAFLDDLDRPTVKRVTADGYRWAALIESSPGRFHGWIRLADVPVRREELTEAARQLARQYGGDPAAADWRHFGRLAGFTNQKSSRRTERGAPFARLRAASRAVAERGAALLVQVRAALAERAVRAADAARAARRRRHDAALFRSPEAMDAAISAFRRARERVTTRRPDGSMDESARDFAAAVRLLEHHHPDQVAAVLHRASPNLEQRHADPDDYVHRTVAAAEQAWAEQNARRSASAPKPTFRKAKA